MTIWNIHLLNARHGLTRVLAEARATARDAVARVSEHADLPPFDLIVRGQTDGTPEGAGGGMAPARGVIEVTVNPDRFDPDLMTRALVRQMYHLIRWEGPARRHSLGEALVGEGLAGHFVRQVLGGRPDAWDATAPSPGLARRAMNEWARLDFDPGEWFLGKGKVRRWAGYGLGNRLVADHVAQASGEDALTLAAARADDFRAAIRALAKADGDDVADDETADHDTAATDEVVAEADAGQQNAEGHDMAPTAEEQVQDGN